MKNSKVVEHFIEGADAKNSNNSFTSRSGYLYSYSLPIAKNLNDLFVVFPANADSNNFYSNTTTKHVSILMEALSDKRVVFINRTDEFNEWKINTTQNQ